MATTRFVALYKGEVLGWYDTLAEAEEAIEQARQAERTEETDFRAWLEEVRR